MKRLIVIVLYLGFSFVFNNTLAIETYPFKFLKLKYDSNHLLISNKNKWDRNVWSIIDNNQKINNALFYPLNEMNLMEVGGYVSDTVNGFTTLKSESIKWNLWNIILYNIIYDNLTIYSPYNPEWIKDIDNGFLNYPFTAENYGNNKKGNFFTDEKFKKNLVDYGLLGREIFAQPEAMTSILNLSEDSIDYEGNVVYYPNDYYWYSDKDIIGYQIKEKWTYNKKGLVTDKKITAIAPIALIVDFNGNEKSEILLFWLDYKELKPILKNYKLLIKFKKRDALISLYKFINNRMFYADIIKKEERFKVSEK